MKSSGTNGNERDNQEERPTKRARIAEGSYDNLGAVALAETTVDEGEEENNRIGNNLETQRTSDLYLDTVRHRQSHPTSRY